MSATMLAILISRQMTIGPKKLSRAKAYHKLQNRPTILSSSREKNTLRKWHIPYSNIWELTRTPRKSRSHLRITKSLCEQEQTSL